MVHFIPANLNVTELVKNKPPHNIEKFNLDILIHIIHLIYAIPATNKDLDIIDGFVPIYSPILQRKAKNYRAYLDYLIDADITMSDNWYITTIKSKGYKFTPKYQNAGFSHFEIKDAKLRKALKQESVFSASIKKKYNHLIKWYGAGLQINKQLALQFIQEDLDRKLADASLLDFDNKTQKPKNAYLQHNSAYINIQRIANAEFKLSIDDNVFRLHSTISNLRSELRNCITFRGENLVSIDIKNSQPYLSTVLLNYKFWQGYQNQNTIRIEDISKGLLDKIFTKGDYKVKSFIMLSESPEMKAHSDIQRFTTLVQQGVFYEYLAKEIGELLNISYSDRKKVKVAVFQVLFTDNRFLAQKDAAPKKCFKELFPTVYEMFARIKKTDKTNLPKLLQRIESHLILLTVTKRIAKEKPKLPIFTIHDSIVTTVGNEHYVQEVMAQELGRAIGIKPQLSLEYWLPENLKFRDGGLFYGEERIAV